MNELEERFKKHLNEIEGQINGSMKICEYIIRNAEYPQYVRDRNQGAYEGLKMAKAYVQAVRKEYE